MRRKVFGPYPCGQGRQLFADPFEVDLRFREALKCDPASVQEKAVSDSADASQAMQLLINATRFAFRLAPFDPNTGNGCTGDDVLDVWNLWADYCAKKKRAWRVRADLAAAGFVTFDYSRLGTGSRFGLWLHADRVIWRHAAGVVRALSAQSEYGLPLDYFEALHHSQDEAQAAYERAILDRAKAATLAKVKLGE